MVIYSYAQKPPVDYLLKNLKEGNEKQKIMAAKELGKLQEQSAVPALKDALQDSSKKVRTAVIEALTNIPGKESIIALCIATEDPVPDNRVLAIKGIVKKYIPSPQSQIKLIFAKIQDLFRLQSEKDMIEPWIKVEPEIDKALIKRLYDQKSVSLEAINAIHLLRITSAIPDLIKLLKGDEDAIVESLKTIADFKATKAGESIIPLLMSKRDKIVSYASYCLGKIQYKPAIEELMKLYSYSADQKYQKYALIGLSLLAAKEAENIFLKNLTSPDSEFRIISAEGLGRIADPKNTEQIARQFLNEKDEEVKLAMDFALFKLKRKEHMMNLIKAINIHYDNVSSYIIELGEEGFAEISRYLPGLEKSVKIKIIKILAASYNPSAIKYIEPYLNDPDIDIATASFEAVKKLKKIEDMKAISTPSKD
jgi:HEAT repeat protein